MLETPKERLRLVKAGFTTNEIEKLYAEGNNLKLVRYPVILELIEIE